MKYQDGKKISVLMGSRVIKRERSIHDVFSGRGGGINAYPGNERYRALCRENRAAYVESPKKLKPLIVRSIIDTIENAGGMFLEKSDELKGCYIPLNDKKKLSKTSQCLREGASKIRASLEETKYGTASHPRSRAASRLSSARLKKAPPVSSHASTPTRNAAASAPVIANLEMVNQVANTQRQAAADSPQMSQGSFSVSCSQVSDLSGFSWQNRTLNEQGNGGLRTVFDRRNSISSSGSGQAR